MNFMKWFISLRYQIGRTFFQKQSIGLHKFDVMQSNSLKGIIRVVLLLQVWGLISLNVAAQNNKKEEKLFEEAKNAYSSKSYNVAIEKCTRIIANNSKSYDAHLLLADIYGEIDSVNLEIQHLTKAKEIAARPVIDFRLGEAYYKKADYSEALIYYNVYSIDTLIPEKRQFLLACKIASCQFAIHSIENPVEFEPRNMGDQVNSEYDEYWPTPSLDGKKLVFTRLIKGNGQMTQEDFYIADLDSAEAKNSEPITEVNTPDNEGAQTLSADSKILFFTACNRRDGLGGCDIYFSRFVNGKWSKPANAGNVLNSTAWEGQPSFSSDNKYLYFSSSRPDGKGNKDIWRAEFKGFSEIGTPQFKTPVNLGAEINTTGNEISPFIHANGRNFYFASDTQIGMGGFDLFTAEIDEFGKISGMKNMGYPINTVKDELGLTICSIGQTAYFSSARVADKGLDIFAFNLDRGLRPTPVSYVKAKITDKKSRKAIQADIELINLSYSPPQRRIENADEHGEVTLALPLQRNYSFNVSQPGYLFYSRSILLKDSSSIVDPFVLAIELESIEVGAKMELYNIYYETDSFRILPQSEPELVKLVAFMKNNADLKVQIQGHTDSTGSAERNQKLSELRAISVVEYLVKNGIDKNRLESAGFGDKVPVADNATEEGRRQNRRTTVKILGT